MNSIVFTIFFCLLAHANNINARRYAYTHDELSERYYDECSSEEIAVFDKYDEKILDHFLEDYLSTDAIELFLNVVEEITGLEMISVASAQIEGIYKRDNFADYIDQDDIQILYEGGFTSTGHYVCIYYRSAHRTVYVYDSMRSGYISKALKTMIKDRYPGTPMQMVKPMTLQPDGHSCGVFSIAYATSILLGLDPAKTPLKIDKDSHEKSLSLRKHIAEMVTHKKLKPFPQ